MRLFPAFAKRIFHCLAKGLLAAAATMVRCSAPAMDPPLPPGLYVVATPIGNLADLSPRAAETLRRSDRIFAEDKRVSAKLLTHAGATAPMSVYHDHSSEADREAIVARLGSEAIALICDAGTPLI